MIDLCGYQTTV